MKKSALKELETFVKEVEEEASEVARQVFARNQAKFEALAKSCVPGKWGIYCGMGAVVINNQNGKNQYDETSEKLSGVLQNAIYQEDNTPPGFQEFTHNL